MDAEHHAGAVLAKHASIFGIRQRLAFGDHRLGGLQDGLARRPAGRELTEPTAAAGLAERRRYRSIGTHTSPSFR